MTLGGRRASEAFASALRVVRPAVAAFLLILPVGALAMLCRQPLLFPSLGPTVFTQVHAPRSEAARPWNALVGHGLGVLSAVVALWLTGAAHGSPPVGAAVTLTRPRVVASALAVGLGVAAQIPLRAAHPPAAATALLITLGGIHPEARAVGAIAAGVLLTVPLARLVRPWLLQGASAPAARALR